MAKKINMAALRAARTEMLMACDTLGKLSVETHLQRGADMNQEVGPVIPTGVFPLDFALGGGLPVGRVSVLFGLENSTKTSTFLKAIAQAQRMCATCYRDVEIDGCECEEVKPFNIAIIDVEGTLDLHWAKNFLGVDVDNILVSKPETAEAALELLDKLLSSKECDIVMLDSVAALEPSAELESTYEKPLQPGSQARMLGRASRALMSRLNALEGETGYRPTIWLTNQIRYKIGVMFGCFHYTARVVLADGSTEKIGTIVTQKKPVSVRTWDAATGQITSARVTNWFNNGKTERFLQFVTQKCGGNGHSKFGVTENHRILTPSGEVLAGELAVGDLVLGQVEDWYTPLQRSVALGSILGDGSIRRVGYMTYQLRFGHGPDQIDYARWKMELFGDLVGAAGPTGKGWGFDIRPTADLRGIAEESYVLLPSMRSKKGERGKRASNRRLSLQLLQELDLRAVATWYMDDASFSGSYEKWGHGKVTISCKNYSAAELSELVVRLVELGLPAPTIAARSRLTWSGDRTRQLQAVLARYIHPSMGYKLHPAYRGQFEAVAVPESQEPRVSVAPMSVIDIYEKPLDGAFAHNRYDLEVEGGHTYFVDGVLVHNSNETVPGGVAFDYTTAVKVRLRGGLKGNDKTNEITHNDVHFRVDKVKRNLMKEGEYRLILSSGDKKKMGEIYDEPFIMSRAEVSMLLLHKGNKWHLTLPGQEPLIYPKKEAVEQALLTDKVLRRALCAAVLTAALNSKESQ